MNESSQSAQNVRKKSMKISEMWQMYQNTRKLTKNALNISKMEGGETEHGPAHLGDVTKMEGG